MNTPNFSSILDQKVTEIKTPKPLPVGTYTCLVDGVPKFDKTKNENATDTLEFSLKVLSAGPDIDQTALNEALDGKPLSDKKLRANFFLTEAAVYRLDKFLFEHLGLELGTVRKEAISQAPGRQVGVNVIHAPSKKGDAIYANVGDTFKV